MKHIIHHPDTKLIMFGLMIPVLLFNTYLASTISSDAPASLATSNGRVITTFITTPDCENCFDLTPFESYLLQSGVAPDDIEEVAYDSREGKKLIKKYGLTKVPSAVLTGDLYSIEDMAELDGSIGDIVDETFVLSRIQPPYLEVDSGDIRGLFEVVYLDDSSCEECYDVNDHKNAFERLVLNPQKESDVDIASEEGQLLVEEYAITVVPTVLLRGDLDEYEELNEIWPLVGTKEEDGTYVLRKGVTDMGPYKSLVDNTVVIPQSEN